jgi:hypothetical protein
VGDLAAERRQSRHFDNRRIAGADFSALLCNDRRGPVGHGLRDEIAAIDMGAGEGEENIAGLHAARIGGKACRNHALFPKLFEDSHGLIHISSRTGSALVRISGFSGASGATPSARRLPAMTWANTGAATSPP